MSKAGGSRQERTLRELREEAQLRPERVAADLDMSISTLLRLESSHDLKKVIVSAFADYYGVEPEVIEPVRKRHG